MFATWRPLAGPTINAPAPVAYPVASFNYSNLSPSISHQASSRLVGGAFLGLRSEASTFEQNLESDPEGREIISPAALRFQIKYLPKLQVELNSTAPLSSLRININIFRQEQKFGAVGVAGTSYKMAATNQYGSIFVQRSVRIRIKAIRSDLCVLPAHSQAPVCSKWLQSRFMQMSNPNQPALPPLPTVRFALWLGKY